MTVSRLSEQKLLVVGESQILEMDVWPDTKVVGPTNLTLPACYYTGRVKGQSNSSVALTLCNGAVSNILQKIKC